MEGPLEVPTGVLVTGKDPVYKPPREDPKLVSKRLWRSKDSKKTPKDGLNVLNASVINT